MGKFIRDLFCGVDNAHYDLARISAALALLTVIGGQVVALVQKQPFDAMSLGTGLATVLGAAGLGISLKDRARADTVNNASQ